MNRILLAAALLAALQPYAVGAKPRPSHRLNPAPGFTVDVPDGFAACDAATNKRLGNAPHLVVLDQFCAAEARHADFNIMINMDESVPLILMVGYSAQYVLPEKFISDATPEMYAALKEEICGRVLRGYIPSSTCNVSAGSLGGHSAFAVEGKIKEGSGKTTVARGYLLTRGEGLAAFMLAAPAPISDKMQAAMDRIIASVKVADLPPPPAPEIVQLDALGLKVSVPKGWIGCDPQHDALLGQAKDPYGDRKACNDLKPATQVLFYDPRLPVMTFFNITHEPGQNDADAFLNDLAPDALTARHDKECADMAAQFSLKNLVTKSCDVKAGKVSGEPAEIVDFTGSGMGEHFMTNVRSRMTLVVRKSDLVVLSLTATSVFDPAIGGDAEAVMSSIVLPAQP